MEGDGPATEKAVQAVQDDRLAIPERRVLGMVDPSFYIIGVGASAGGLDAIKQLVGQSTEKFPHTFVVIQHISPDHKSLMTEIIGRETSLPVKEVTDNMPLEQGHIYLIPPNGNVVIQGTHDDTQPLGSEEIAPHGGLRFSIVAPTPRPQINLPIDLFFHSLAEAVGDRAIAVVLSGTGSDGSRGLMAVKDREGFVVVQDPETADFAGMPNAAIATNIVDLVAAPDAMISEIRRYIELREDGVLNIDALFEGAAEEFQDLVRRISEVAGIDFSQYKEPTLRRRIARRIVLNEFQTVTEYLEFIESRPSELSVLHREFLVGVTNFFRDLPAWNALDDGIIEKLFADGDQNEPVKVWSVGCSTGEEAYSIAILMDDFRQRSGTRRDFRVFATDVNEHAIRSAREGIYPISLIDEIPDRFRTADYVSVQSGTFSIPDPIRHRVLFSKHNVLEDPPYINTDLVICRNLLIYLSPEMQKRVLSLFSFSLRHEGRLFLGAAETVAHQFAQFETEVQKARIYTNKRLQVGNAFRPRMEAFQAMPMPRIRRLAVRASQQSRTSISDLLLSVLSNVQACTIVVDAGGQILETFGNYRDFVTLPEQAFSANLFDLVSGRLRSSISLQLRRAEKNGMSEALGVKCPVEDRIDLFDNHCSQIEWDAHPVAYAVLLKKSGDITTRSQEIPDAGALPEPTAQDVGIVARYESEIEALQEMLNVTTEDLGVSNEELQTANEELTVSNEELQANNEEMQSINEELHTVNGENTEKIALLEAANADIENLLDTSDLAVLILDTTLSIRRFNTAFTRYIGLQDDDVGRQLMNFSSNFERADHDRLLGDAQSARDENEEVHRELRLKNGNWALSRVRPFKTPGGTSDGVAITLLDITRSKLLQEEVEVQRDRLEGLLESEAAGYWDWDIPTNTEFLSPRFKEMCGYTDDEMESSPEAWMQITHPDDLPIIMANLDEHVKSGGKVPYDNEVRFFHKSGSVVWVKRRGRVTEWGPDNSAQRMLGVHFDITDLKEREEKVFREAEEIRRFAFIAAHDLLQPVNTIERSLNGLMEDIAPTLDAHQTKLLSFLNDATGRMRARIRGVLDYARFFDETMEFEDADLGDVLSHCLEDLGSQIDEIDAEVTVGPLPHARCKPDLLAQVFQNLLSNGMKYRRQGRRCRIWVEEVPAPDGFVAIRVKDNGIGIDPEHREQVFKLFSRLHNDTEYEGLGVGLAVCHRVLKLHQGKIWIEDGEDGGTAFVCWLLAPGQAGSEKGPADRR